MFMLLHFGRGKLGSAFFDVTVSHPNAEYISKYIGNTRLRKRGCASRVLEVEHGTMAEEYKRLHSRLAELIALKKGEEYS